MRYLSLNPTGIRYRDLTKNFHPTSTVKKEKKTSQTNHSIFKPGTNHNPSIDGHDSSELYKILLQNIKSFKQHQ